MMKGKSHPQKLRQTTSGAEQRPSLLDGNVDTPEIVRRKTGSPPLAQIGTVMEDS
jgi:hypothetical protein